MASNERTIVRAYLPPDPKELFLGFRLSLKEAKLTILNHAQDNDFKAIYSIAQPGGFHTYYDQLLEPITFKQFITLKVLLL